MDTKEIRKKINDGNAVVIDFYATWCGPCKVLSPIVDSVAEEYKSTVSTYKVDIEEEEDFATEYRVRNIPTVIFFKDGTVVNKTVGSVSRNIIEENYKAIS